ncbi:MAG: WD40 repeat domain-containing protein [Bacteroidales bacterium]|nr:WD40 repeat domain-containing protein [Bacteroidales bacterium]MCF8390142.1 WD40 repeat domain-containing protein [Bacteroidales bacterium]
MKTFIILILIFLSSNLYSQKDPYLLKNIKASDRVNAIAFSPDGAKILAGFNDGSAEIIDIASGKTEVKVADHWKGVMDVEMDPKGKYFMTAGDNTIKIWSPEGDRIYNLKKHTTTIYTADIDPSGTYMISAAVSPAFKYWDVLKGEFKEDVMTTGDRTMTVRYSRDGKRIASGSSDHIITIWDAESFEKIMELKGHSDDIFAVDFSPNGKLLASCSKDKTIRIYDLEKGELLRILSGHKNFVMDVEFAPDNQHLVSCSFDNEIRIWEVPTGKNMYSFIDHELAVTDICFSPDGSQIASASHDETIKIWKYTSEIFVDFYYSDEVIAEMEEMEEFRPKEKAESKSDYLQRQEKAAQLKSEIYAKYYERYKKAIADSSLPGMNK